MSGVQVDAAEGGIPPNHRTAVDIANLQFVPPLEVLVISDAQVVAEAQRRVESAPWMQHRLDVQTAQGICSRCQLAKVSGGHKVAWQETT